MKRKTGRFLWGLGGLLLLGLVVWVGLLVAQTYLKYNVKVARKTGTGVPVKVAAVRLEEFPEVIGANSLAEATLTIEVETQVSGRIKAVPVDVGTTVSKGETLVELDPTLFLAAARSAQDNVAKTKAELEKSIKLSVTMREELKAAFAAAQDILVKTQTELHNSQLSLTRSNVLYDHKVIAKAELEAAEAKVSAAKAANTVAVSELTKAQNELTNADTTIQAMLDGAKFSYTNALEQLAKAELDLQNTTVKSPSDGVIMKRPSSPNQIVERIVSPGETVQAGNILLLLGEMRSIMVVANVPEEKVGSVYLKQRAEVVFDAYRNTVLSGAVVKIDPQINPEKRTFKAYIRVEDPKLKLTPGLSAYARLEHKRKALTIPRLAMIKNADEATVFVVETSRARLRRIKTGAELLHKVEVLSGLKEGEEVVYYGLLGLKDNDLVNVETLARTE